METLILLLTDVYFWVGFGTLLASLSGFFWIVQRIRTQKDEEEIAVPMPTFDIPNIEPALPPTPPPAPEPAPTPTPAPAAAPGNAAPTLGADKTSVENLSRQLEKIQATLDQTLIVLTQLSNPVKQDISHDIKGILEALKAQNDPDDKENLLSMSDRIEQIYKILAALSKTK